MLFYVVPGVQIVATVQREKSRNTQRRVLKGERESSITSLFPFLSFFFSPLPISHHSPLSYLSAWNRLLPFSFNLFICFKLFRDSFQTENYPFSDSMYNHITPATGFDLSEIKSITAEVFSSNLLQILLQNKENIFLLISKND